MRFVQTRVQLIAVLLILTSSLYGQYLFYDNSGGYPPINSSNQFTVVANTTTDGLITPLHQFIRESQKSLLISIYEVKEPSIQREIIEALKRGVNVKMIVEPNPVGNGCDAFSRYNQTDNINCEKSAQFTTLFYQTVEKLQKKFPPLRGSLIRYFNKNLCWDDSTETNQQCFQHGKMIVRDEQDILISTGNFNDSSLCVGERFEGNSCNRDYTLITHSISYASTLKEIVSMDIDAGAPCDLPPKTPRKNKEIRYYTEGQCHAEEKEVDAQIYKKKLSSILQKNSLQSSITVSPISHQTLIDLLNSAQRSIQIETQYLKEPEWHSAIMRALKRGVRVELTLASLCHFSKDSKGVGWIKKGDFAGENGYFKKWLEPLRTEPLSEVSIFNRGAPDMDNSYTGYLHTKAMVIDNTVAWIGSINGSFTSTHMNREYGLIVHEKELVKGLSTILHSNHQAGLTLEEHIPAIITGQNPTKVHAGQCKVSFSREDRFEH